LQLHQQVLVLYIISTSVYYFSYSVLLILLLVYISMLTSSTFFNAEKDDYSPFYRCAVAWQYSVYLPVVPRLPSDVRCSVIASQ